MNLRKRSKASAEVFTASLNDIMFFLLLFFLMTYSVAAPSVMNLLLPNSKTSAKSTKHPLTITVNENLEYTVNNEPVTKDGLEAAVKSAIATQMDPTALLKVDKAIQVQNLVDILDIGARNKIKMVLATETTQK
ncbi:MAG: hypothetical protein RIQ89_601 [Bacteroidota bacterium]|jgi:biopolymer transport protein ExbD